MTTVEEFVYARIKDVFVNDEGDLVLFIFAGLTINTIAEDVNGRKINVRPVVSNLIEVPAREALPVYLAMDDNEERHLIEKSEFRFLSGLFKTNLTEFMTYHPSK